MLAAKKFLGVFVFLSAVVVTVLGIHAHHDDMWHKGGQYVIMITHETEPYDEKDMANDKDAEKLCAEDCSHSDICNTMMFSQSSKGGVCFFFAEKFYELESFFCESPGVLCSEIWVKLPHKR
ncbi:uncharacterized protein LOC144435711 [Glandiceps talaboti]